MWGTGVISTTLVTSNSVACIDLIEASLPDPGPLIFISIFFIPLSIATWAACSAAICAANGVPFLVPLNPEVPPDFQAITLPSVSVIVTTVLLKVECIYAIPLGMFFAFFLLWNYCFLSHLRFPPVPFISS